MKTLLLSLIALTIGILPMAADQWNAELQQSKYLPALPPGWEIIKIEPVEPQYVGEVPQHVEMFLMNRATGQAAVWLVYIGFQ